MVHEMVAARRTDQALDDEQRSRKAGLTLRSILKEEAYAPLYLHYIFFSLRKRYGLINRCGC